MNKKEKKRVTNWLKQPVFSNLSVSWEELIFAFILILAAVSRFYNVGARVMSHDENSHVYYAWRLFKGFGYAHDPITHGPLQFHALALTYFLFGASDFTARIPTILAGLATIGFLWKYRRYLGSWGTIIAAALTFISPFMLYYSRYVRNEAYVALFGVITLWYILRYLETSSPRYLYWMTAATALHFTTKETSFIYTAQAMVFFGLVFIHRVTQQKWKRPHLRKFFLITLVMATLLLAIGLVVQTTSATIPNGEETSGTTPFGTTVSLVLGGLALLFALAFVIRGYSWGKLRALPSFSAMLLLGTLVLPLLAPFPLRFLGWDLRDFSQLGIIRTGGFILLFTLIAAGFGLAWNKRVWLINLAVFYIPFTILYTTVFSNGRGFFTGLASLGYWLDQQKVERGGQPWYYYWMIQVPIYEYLPAFGSLGTMLAIGIHRLKERLQFRIHDDIQNNDQAEISERKENESERAPVFSLLTFWVLTSLIAYSIAGEKMPWLAVHIAWPMILLSGWGFQKLVDHFDSSHFKQNRGWLAIFLSVIFLVALSNTIGSLLSSNPPFQGHELDQLARTGTFFTNLLFTVGTGAGLKFVLRGWEWKQYSLVGILTFLFILGLFTTHTSIQTSYINYNSPKEYLVYAHCMRGVKVALGQIEDVSLRISDGLNIQVAYDNETTYPYLWYLRDYPNQYYYGENPTRTLRDYPLILVGDTNYGKIEPVIGNAYHEFEYNRIAWPNQDYYHLTWNQIWNAIRDPAMRDAIFQIWLNRDFGKYAEVLQTRKGDNANSERFTLANWGNARTFRLYVRKDITSKVWNYGTFDKEVVGFPADPYEGNEKSLIADAVYDQLGLNNPRNLAAAQDGTVYVLDTGNHRIVHISQRGDILNTWGAFSGAETINPPPGTFNEPWGIAVGPEGNVYVADTWNHRIQKFSLDGDFLHSWGQFEQAESATEFWGPRDIVVDKEGHVYISDTGNKRVVVFTANGDFLLEFGGSDVGEGQFNEPVGLALDDEGSLYVADAWNQRIQVFEKNENGIARNYARSWSVDGWYGQSLDNKPYLAISENNIYVSDPEGSRVLVFNLEGEFQFFWVGIGAGQGQFILPMGVTTDIAPGTGLWVCDSKGNLVLYYAQ